MRIRIPPALKKQFTDTLKAKKISQQVAINQLVTWFVGQEDLYQSMLLGQLGEEAQREVSALILSRGVGGEEEEAKRPAVDGKQMAKQARRNQQAGKVASGRKTAKKLRPQDNEGSIPA